MTRAWFREDNCSLPRDDRAVLNRAMRRLVDHHNLSATVSNLSLVRQTYNAGMSGRDLINAVNNKREELRY